MQYDPYNSMAMNVLSQQGRASMPQNSSAAVSPLANMASMSPTAMNNYMGNPMDNAGGNVVPFLESQQKIMPNRSGALSTYAHGGMVDLDSQAESPHMNQQLYRHGGTVYMQGGGMPMDAPMMNGDPMMDEPMDESADDAGELDPALVEQVQIAVQFTQQFLDQQQEGYQLIHINPEEYEVLIQQFGEPQDVTEHLKMFAEGGEVDLEEATEAIASSSEDDPILIAVLPEQFEFLTQEFGEPTINEITGLLQFGFFKSVAKAVKSVVKNPIVQALAPIALNAFAPGLGSALGGALGLGNVGTSALIGGGMGLLGGGGLKGALSGAAMGGLGQMGSDYLSSGNNPFSGIFGGSTPGTSGTSPFGLTGNSGAGSGVGLNPVSGAAGLKPPSVLPGAGGTDNSLWGRISNLLPSSTLGKVALGGGALLGLGGLQAPKVEDMGGLKQAQLDPSFTQPMKLQRLNRERNQNFNPNYFIAEQDPTARQYFNDSFVPIEPEIKQARRGGMTRSYAGGGPVSDYERSHYEQPRRGALSDRELGRRRQPGMNPRIDYNDEMHQRLFKIPIGGGMPAMGQGMMPMQQPMQQPMQAPMNPSNPMNARPLDLQTALGPPKIGGLSFNDGGLLAGDTDGTADRVPATIAGRQAARLSDGEFVVPSRIVAEIGEGNTNAGAKKLYRMIDQVDQKRRSLKDYAGSSHADRELARFV